MLRVACWQAQGFRGDAGAPRHDHLRHSHFVHLGLEPHRCCHHGPPRVPLPYQYRSTTGSTLVSPPICSGSISVPRGIFSTALPPPPYHPHPTGVPLRSCSTPPTCRSKSPSSSSTRLRHAAPRSSRHAVVIWPLGDRCIHERSTSRPWSNGKTGTINRPMRGTDVKPARNFRRSWKFPKRPLLQPMVATARYCAAFV